MKDNGFIVLDVFKSFNDKDKRKWCLLINPGQESIFCTCYANFDNEVSVAFEFNDGGKKIPKNFWIVGLALVFGYMLYRNVHRN